MKQHGIIGLLSLVLFVVLFLLGREFFLHSGKESSNKESQPTQPKEYDSTAFSYQERRHFDPSVKDLSGIAVDANSVVYIAGGKEVRIYNKDLQMTGGFKISDEANCIAADDGHCIYLGIDNHVEVYNLKGVLLKKWNGYREDGFITSIALKGNTVFTADAGSRAVLMYDTEGRLLAVIGTSDNVKFIIPSMYFDVAIGKDGSLWAANTGKHELENFNDQGRRVRSWGKASMETDGFGGCCNPSEFSILPDGSFVTYEKGLNRIKIYDEAGNYVCMVSGSPRDEQAMQYCSKGAKVHDLAVSPAGEIFVLDAGSGLVRIFARK